MDIHTKAIRPKATAGFIAAMGVLVLVATLALAPPARATPIPTGTSPADDLILNFDTSTLGVGSGRLTFYLSTSGLNAGDVAVIDLFGGANGQNLLGVAYTGPFASYSGNCTIGDPLCSYLFDGAFSVGVRMTSGMLDIAAAFVYATDVNEMSSSATNATIGQYVLDPPTVHIAAVAPAAVPEPGTIALSAAALLMLGVARRRSLPARRG